MKIIAITQVRLSSTRLPRKVLLEVNGKSLLQIHLERVLKSKLLDKIIVATTNEPDVHLINQIALKCNCGLYNGSLENVLERFYYAALPLNPDYVVRITSDCPLIDAQLIDDVIEAGIKQNIDYCSNSLKRTYPDGMDVEMMSFNALKIAFENATQKFDKEHVTPYIINNSTFLNGDMFTSMNIENNNLEHDYGNVRLTLDYQSDYSLIKKLLIEIGEDKTWKEYADKANEF
jgi:spore coat polysaccharide biosynthesis protein SpsF (cytidylyltransferase family)